ncbi:MAG TPA: class I tRNA ligase family protein, partial [Cyclobacteriaceae bacterium]|nr:class I tRNA ligase family protein [Cyclobacteriaceae bacterium]
MAEYSKEEIKRIEEKWRNTWQEKNVYKVENDTSKPKCYVLDMFPYPSGAGLHVGHPLGYIASDIYARFKRLKGFNVLHPMGFDAFGLPAEQYALEHGVHPAKSTQDNILNFKRQLGSIGFCYDWSREVQTCDPKYYKWTQWIFLQIFDCWFNRKTNKAERITTLTWIFENEGNAEYPFPNPKFRLPNGESTFLPVEWKAFNQKQRQEILMQYRLAYLAYTDVNWCEALGTVLANDEVVNGVSYRGGFPVVKRQMRQWSLRITEYAERLLKGLDEIDFSDSMKEIQRNWIGKSVGCELDFDVVKSKNKIRVFTTRPDTIFGVDFMVLAPEHDLVRQITPSSHKGEVEKYLKYVESRSEVERMAEVKKVTGCFTGAYATNPLSGRQVPIWISEYVLAGYGTGAIMGVPCGDERDHKFAKHFNIPITNIIGKHYTGEDANPTKDAILENSGFLNGLVMHKAIDVAISAIEDKKLGKRQINYKMRDAGWSRQRYWGEPFPVVFRNDMPYPMNDVELPLALPNTDNFKPSGNGEGPLANLKNWINFSEGAKRDSNTMPTHAGAAWYFLRYMDPHNENEFAGKAALDYWNQVDVYIGGSEHAVAHLLYSRLWVKILHDLGYLNFDEPFKKLINQGKITGDSRFVYRIDGSSIFVSRGFYEKLKDVDFYNDQDQLTKYAEYFNALLPKPYFGAGGSLTRITLVDDRIPEEDRPIIKDFGHNNLGLNKMSELRVHVELVSGVELNIEALRKWRADFSDAIFILEDENGNPTLDSSKGKYITGSAIEKMSKSYYNVINPDDIVTNYGADTLRLYEMFLGPLEASKPWITSGIDGCYKFLKRFWNLFHDNNGNWNVSDAEPTREEMKVLHTTIKKVEQD